MLSDFGQPGVEDTFNGAEHRLRRTFKTIAPEKAVPRAKRRIFRSDEISQASVAESDGLGIGHSLARSTETV